MPRPSRPQKKSCTKLRKVPTTQAGPQENQRVGGRTLKQRQERNANEAKALAAVNGVIIPSKVAPGASPNQGKWQDGPSMVYPCSICERKFKESYQVKSHMAFCVSKNGNPTGAFWDDAWNQAAGQAAPVAVTPA